MTEQDVRAIADQTFNVHPELRGEDQAEELLRRTIWRLNQAGIVSGRQRNPSGLLSRDKLCVRLTDGDHAYDLYGLQTPLSFSFGEVFPPNLVADEGIPDGAAAPINVSPAATHKYVGGGNDTGECDVCHKPRFDPAHAIPESKTNHAYDGGEQDTGLCDICQKAKDDPIHAPAPIPAVTATNDTNDLLRAVLESNKRLEQKIDMLLAEIKN